MFHRTLSLVAVATFCATSALADGHSTLKGFALAESGSTLITMQSLAKPGEIASYKLSARLDAIAYRPVTDELLGFSREGAVYSINKKSGELTNLGAKFDDNAKIAGNSVAFDFNNKIDAVRAVGSDGANFVYFPTNFGDERAGTVKRFTDTFYADGDVNVGTTPLIFANAYTNAIAGKKAGDTFQYALDARTDSLVSLANNAGELKTVAKVTIDGQTADLVTAGGFDIVSEKEGEDQAYAVLQLDGSDTSGLYSLNLETAEATLIADLGTTGFTGFAVSASLDKTN